MEKIEIRFIAHRLFCFCASEVHNEKDSVEDNELHDYAYEEDEEQHASAR